MANFKMTVNADCAVSHVAPPFVYNSSCPLIVRVEGWELAFGQASTSPPTHLAASIQKEANFLSTHMASLTAFEWQEPNLGLKY